MMLTIPAVLSSDEVAQCRASLSEADWEDGRTTAGHQAHAVKRNAQLPLDSAVGQEWSSRILDRLGRTPLFIAAALPLRVLPPRFNRYEDGGAYGSHIDAALFRSPADGQYVRSDLSCTLFLSEADSYDGGELTVEDHLGTHSVKLKAGDMILYPGSSHHHVTPVTRGSRLAAFFWVQSLVRRDEERRQLFTLDQAIQSLSADHPEHQSIASLTGLYHNLLRQWSDT